MPTEQEEAARDLLRCREDIRADLLRARHRLSKFLLRHGRRFTGTKKAWSQRHEAWLRAQTWPIPALDQTHRAYLRTVEEAVARLRAVEDDLRALLDLEPLRARVDPAAVLPRHRRPDRADHRRRARRPPPVRARRRRPMAFVGLVPSEHSSGGKRAQGGITKTGNAHLRRVLVEAAWHYRHHPFVGRALRQRQVDAPPDGGGASVDRPAAAPSEIHAAGRPRQAQAARRHGRRARAHRLRVGGPDPVIGSAD